jgi:hypothetical protein
VDHVHPQPSPQVPTIEDASRSEDLNSLILENHDEFHGVQEIFINYTSFRELFYCNTMVVNLCFYTDVAQMLVLELRMSYDISKVCLV